jgi:hypothetical protein
VAAYAVSTVCGDRHHIDISFRELLPPGSVKGLLVPAAYNVIRELT